MITIKQTTDIMSAEQFLSSIGVNISITHDIVMQISHKEEIYGVGTLSLENSKVSLNKLYIAPEMDTMQNKLGLAKALLNFADIREIKKIYGTNLELEDVYKALRFENIGNEYMLDLHGYFTVHC